jgi:glycosidase
MESLPPWMHVPWYEIRFESFQDSLGNGIGDIPGATSRLAHIADLVGAGIEGRVSQGLGGIVWVTPFYPSPNVDGGYDIANFVAVDPLYGTMDDFDRFCLRAQELGLGVVVDLVLNHSSDRHPWFLRERLGKAAEPGLDRGALGEFYVWRDEQPEDWFRIIFNDSEWSNWSYDRYALADGRPLPLDAALSRLGETDPVREWELRERLSPLMSELLWPQIGVGPGCEPDVNPYYLARRIEHMARSRPALLVRSVEIQEELNEILQAVGLPRIGRWYLHRFKTEQPDLNWYNPHVERLMLEVIDFWLGKPGVVGFRADAIPYAFLGEKDDGYEGENHPLTHALLARMRAHIDARHPNKFMVCESNMPPALLFPYFGTPEAPECHAVYDFTITPALPWAFMLGHAGPMVTALSEERPPSLGAERDLLNLYDGVHDEKTLEKVRPEIREALWQFYCRDDPWDPACPEDPRYRLNLGYRSRTAVWLGGDVRRQVLLHGIGIALEGSPLIYYGDEIGMGSLILDDRDGLRLPMQWDDSPHAGFTTGEPFREMIAEGRFGYREGVNVAAQRADPGSLLNILRDLFHRRQRSPALFAGGQRILRVDDPAVLALLRYTEEEAVLVVGNFSAQPVRTAVRLEDPLFDSRPEIPLDIERFTQVRSMFTGHAVPLAPGEPVTVEMERYDVFWMTLE